jgi:hypothetical protein
LTDRPTRCECLPVVKTFTTRLYEPDLTLFGTFRWTVCLPLRMVTVTLASVFDRLCFFSIVTSEITNLRGFVVFSTTGMKRPFRPFTVKCLKIVIVAPPFLAVACTNPSVVRNSCPKSFERR